MKVIIILAAIALTHGAKLERTYLPPSNARTAGGSGNFLQTPISEHSGNSATNFQRNYNVQPAFNNGISQSGNDFPQSGNTFAQSGNTFAQSGNDFSQSGNDFAQPGNNFAKSGNGFSQTEAQYGNVNFANEARPERPRAAFERNAAILRQDSSNDGEQYSYAYETENGIYAEENGVATNGVEAQGGYSYTGDDGQVYSVRYTADQNGFVPQGDHLPTPPPVPEEILKALEQNARDEAAGIYDDGSYNEGKYAAADNNNYNNKFNYQQNNGYNSNDDDSVVTNSAFSRSGNNFNAPSGNAGIASTYGAPNVIPNSGIAPTYGAPSENAPKNVINYNVPSGNGPIAPTYDALAQNTRSYNAPNAGHTPSFNAPAENTPFSPKSGPAGVDKAYLPPFADQRGQARNTFGRRQQSFDARTGYKY